MFLLVYFSFTREKIFAAKYLGFLSAFLKKSKQLKAQSYKLSHVCHPCLDAVPWRQGGTCVREESKLNPENGNAIFKQAKPKHQCG